ncbi:unnamed protein product [Thelazia callipaeda]|uniref:RecQ-mediated genome instability protein 1 n=1 Tax=Thelazia callipaeda TaxID=103827 RepID=A0A0N5CVH0_THECL|nr:unnamed protein product [Thelazia callipaeda]
MTDEEKSAVMSIFANFNVTLKEAWLNEVLEYLHEKRADADTSTITQLVYEQWLYSELSKSTRPTIRLPPFAKKASLKTDVVVQINWIVDIHTSMYSKLREHTGRGIDSTLFQSEVNDNSWDAESEGQMFLMEITDGQRKLRAIEYQKIDGLCTMLLPGTKLFISGDTICRNSVLLLTPKNAVLLGGESEMCQKNAPVVIFARRLGINERKLEIVECKTNSIADGMEMKKINSIQSFASNAPGNSAPQRVIDIRNEESTKRRNIERKNQKKPVLSRTITSYFQQQRRGFHSKMESYNESKSFIHSTDQNIKAQNDVNYPLQCEEENAKFLSSSIISNSAIDSSSSHFPSALAHISELEQESSLTSHKRLSTSEILQSQICNMKKTNDYSHLESKSQKLVEKSTNSTKKCPSSNIANFFVSKKCVEIEASQPLISARLLAKNLEITQSSEIMSTSKEDATAPPNIVLLSGESKRAELPSASKVPIWSVEVQKPLAAESIRSATIIPSSDMQEAHTVETAKCTERAHIAAEEGMMGSQYNWKKRLSEIAFVLVFSMKRIRDECGDSVAQR